MNRKSMAIVSLVVVLVLIAASIWAAARVPDAARLPIHWDFNGNPNGYAGKWTALLITPVVTALLSLLFYFLPKIEPRERNLERSQGLVFVAWGGLLLVNIAVEVTIIGGALHWSVPVQGLMLAVIGLFFAATGNQLGKSRSMFLAGIRTPWTLSSEDVWIKTNRLGGKLMMAAGLVMIAAAVLPVPGRAVPVLIIALVVVMVGVPLVYSYALWRRERSAGQPSA